MGRPRPLLMIRFSATAAQKFTVNMSRDEAEAHGGLLRCYYYDIFIVQNKKYRCIADRNSTNYEVVFTFSGRLQARYCVVLCRTSCWSLIKHNNNIIIVVDGFYTDEHCIIVCLCSYTDTHSRECCTHYRSYDSISLLRIYGTL